MKVLLGTTNPSKVKRFEELLNGCDIEFCTLRDLGIDHEPKEIGKTPEENAVIKANFYGQFFDAVICNDSGLYFDALPLDDSRQPGLNIRTPQGGRRLNDEEMITYYSELVHSLGGKVLAYYLDGIAVYVPVLDASRWVYECEVVRSVETGESTTFFCRALNVQIDERIECSDTFDIDLTKLDPVIYSGMYHSIGKLLGRIGDFTK
jgi:hypothetical protein